MGWFFWSTLVMTQTHSQISFFFDLAHESLKTFNKVYFLKAMHSASVHVKTEVYFGLYLSYRDYGGSNEGRKKDESSLSLILDGCVVGCCWLERCVRLNDDERNVSSSDHVLVCMPALLYTHTVLQSSELLAQGFGLGFAQKVCIWALLYV